MKTELIFPPCSGAVLNLGHGRKTGQNLIITVKGLAPSGADVAVNGLPTQRADKVFTVDVALKPGFNNLAVECNGVVQTTTVVWDYQSFKRFHFFVDDVVFFLTELGQADARSLFDHFYTAQLRTLHEKYGVKVVLNLFFRNDHTPFVLSRFPDTFRGEWEANADWLRLAFHAYSEFPGSPYSSAHPDALPEHYEAVRDQVLRFAGPNVFYPPAIVHFYSVASPDARRFLSQAGCRAMAIRELPEPLLQADIPVLYEAETGWFRMPVDLFCNKSTVPQIETDLTRITARQWQDTLMIGTHEQYSYSWYQAWQPDHFERMETAVRMATEAGYKPVFFHDGLLGNTTAGI